MITYNVLVGFHHGDQADAGAKWLADQKPNVVALQELNGVTADSLKTLAKRWGHEHCILLKETGYPVGITSKEPITLMERFLDPAGHGFLHAQTADIDFLVIHFHPGDYKKRRIEAARVCERVEDILKDSRPLVLLGDFNTHSRKDRDHLVEQTRLLERRAKGRTNLVDGMFDFRVIDVVEKTGLIDACYLRRGEGKIPEATFPTRTLSHVDTPEKQSDYLERIDFVFLSGDLAKRCHRARASRHPILETTSDHYPVIVDIAHVR